MRTALGFTHITSDPHFLHENIISFCGRPFSSLEHQIEGLISRHNAVVRNEDHVLYLGDLWVNATRGAEIMQRLRGRKTLVRGNHDSKLKDEQLLSWGFEAVHPATLDDEIDGVAVQYCHYPYWRPGGNDDRYKERRPVPGPRVLIHGHTHASTKYDDSFCVHAGVDAWDLRPAYLVEIADLVHLCAQRRGL